MNEIKRLRNELENKNKENEDLKALNVKILNIAKNLDKSNNELKSKIDNLQLDLDKKSEIIINQNKEIKDKSDIIINQNQEIKDKSIFLIYRFKR